MQPPIPNDPNRPGRVEELGTYEMIWDCKFCGTQNLPALSRKFCPNCGAAQDPNTRHFPSDEEKIRVENYVRKGATLICPACGTPNLGDSHFCMQCGSPLDAATKAKTIASEVRAENASFAQGADRDLAAERMAEDLGTAAPAAAPRKTNWLPILAIGAVVIVLLIGAIVALTAKRTVTVTVEGHDWQRIVYIEQFTRVSDGAWDEQVPAGAYGVSCRERQRSTRQVPDGEECAVRRIDNGDGTFSERRECTTVYRDEPVYDNYCTFNINRWVPDREARASGASLASAPMWPQLNLSTGSGLGAERESGRREVYVVRLSADGARYECELPFDIWQEAQVGESYEISVGVVTNRPDCTAIETAERQ